MNYRIVIAITFLLSITVAERMPARTPALQKNKEFVIMGIMQHTDIEGGCWYVDTKNGKFELTGSPKDLATCKVEGRQLTLRVRSAGMMASICMVGKMVEIIEVIDTVFHPHNPPVDQKKITGIIHKTRKGCWYVLTASKKKYEMQAPIPKQFMKIGKRYSRVSKTIPGNEGNCNMKEVILFSMSEPDLKIVPKYNNPK